MMRLLVILITLVIWSIWPEPAAAPIQPDVQSEQMTFLTELVTKSLTQPVEVAPLPAHVQITNVPFIPQAPLKKWDALHEDACEEASLLTLRYWLAARQPDAAEIERELQAFIAWQAAHDYGPSITLAQLKRAATQYWAKPWWSEIKVGQSATLDDLRRELAAGNPVVIGAAGRELKNPHFNNGGPNYHMLVLIGYDENGFVTNDPGTQFGAGYRYTNEIIDAAWHDWDEQNILSGTRNYLVIK